MSKLWRLVPPQVKFWLYVALLAGVLASYAYVFHRGAQWKEDSMEAKTIIKTITVREKQNAIRDNRPSVRRTADRVLNNTF